MSVAEIASFLAKTRRFGMLEKVQTFLRAIIQSKKSTVQTKNNPGDTIPRVINIKCNQVNPKILRIKVQTRSWFTPNQNGQGSSLWPMRQQSHVQTDPLNLHRHKPRQVPEARS